MSSVVISGDTSGAVTLTVPAVAGTNTVTIAAQTGTLNAAGPAFSAYQSTQQTLTANVKTKIQFQTEEFDTNNNFDNATNYRFTPTIAGYYQINASVFFNTANIGFAAIQKNGTDYKRGAQSVTTYCATANSIVYMNGSTDYVEIWAQANAITTLFNDISGTYFNGVLVRGA